MFWSPHFETDIPELEKIMEKVAEFGIVRTGNRDQSYNKAHKVGASPAKTHSYCTHAELAK